MYRTTLKNLYKVSRYSKGMNWQASQVVGLVLVVFIGAVYIALLSSTAGDTDQSTSCSSPLIQGLGNLIGETTDQDICQ
jgi:hypothetical protein